MMTIYMTIREFNKLTDFGRKVRTAKEFEYFARNKWHRCVDELDLLFKFSLKNRAIKKSWIAKNVRGIYKYHRTERLERANIK